MKVLAILSAIVFIYCVLAPLIALYLTADNDDDFVQGYFSVAFGVTVLLAIFGGASGVVWLFVLAWG